MTDGTVYLIQTPHQQTDKLNLAKNPELICAGGGFGPVSFKFGDFNDWNFYFQLFSHFLPFKFCRSPTTVTAFPT